MAAARRCQPSWSGQQGEIKEAKPLRSFTLALSPSLYLSFTRSSKPSTTIAIAELHCAHTPPPPRHYAIACTHHLAITSSTSLTCHCLSSNQGKGLRAIAIAAIAVVHHQAPSSPVASPIHRSSYLLLRQSIVAPGHRCSCCIVVPRNRRYHVETSPCR